MTDTTHSATLEERIRTICDDCWDWHEVGGGEEEATFDQDRVIKNLKALIEQEVEEFAEEVKKILVETAPESNLGLDKLFLEVYTKVTDQALAERKGKHD